MVTAEHTNKSVRWLKWIDRLSVLLAIVGGIAITGLMVNVVLDVLGRVLYNRPFPDTLDLTQFAWMPSAVSLGLGYALLRAEHVRVNLLTAPTGPRTQRIIEIVAMVFTIGTLALMIGFGIEKAQAAMEVKERAVGARWLEIWPFRWVLIVGLSAMLLQAIASLLRAITAKEFRPDDQYEIAVALEMEESVLDELGDNTPKDLFPHDRKP